jgi:hypothetical protein
MSPHLVVIMEIPQVSAVNAHHNTCNGFSPLCAVAQRGHVDAIKFLAEFLAYNMLMLLIQTVYY